MAGRWYDMDARHWRSIVGGAIILGVLYACVVFYVLVRLAEPRPLPFSYADLTPAGAYPRDLCPGEPLRFRLRVSVATAPSLVTVAENWQAADGGATVADAAPVLYIQEAVKVAEVTQAAIVPALPAGDWVYERAAIVAGVTTPALLLIPFTVRNDCA